MQRIRFLVVRKKACRANTNHLQAMCFVFRPKEEVCAHRGPRPALGKEGGAKRATEGEAVNVVIVVVVV